MGFPRQGYWSGLPFPFSGDLSNPGIEPEFPALADKFLTIELPGKTTAHVLEFSYFCKNICFPPTNFLRMCCYRDDCLKERMRRSNSRWTVKEQNTYFMSLFLAEPALAFTPLLMKSLWKKGRYLEIL